MESLNSYASDGESDASPSPMVRGKYGTKFEEADANCEPVTMDMSEPDDSSNDYSDDGEKQLRGASSSKRQYSKSLSTSPATSYSSDSSGSRRSRVRKDSKTDPTINRRYDDDRRDARRSKYDKEYRYEENDNDRRRRDDRRDRRRDRDDDRYSSRKHDRKRQRSRSRSSSRRSYRRRSRSRSRSRSYDRHVRRSSPNRKSSRRRSPERTRRTRSRSKSQEKPRAKNWKSASKLKVLEKLGIELKVPPVAVETPVTGLDSNVVNTSSQLTPQLLLQKTIEEQVNKVKSATGIALPSYYNPMAINPTKYAEQIQKRRLLWGNKEKQASTSSVEENIKTNPTAESKSGGTIWQGAKFGGDQDGKMTAKFQRLMGIKNPVTTAVAPESKTGGTDLIKKQEELFNSMESQYEVARMTTHTHRGIGLGFSSFQPR